jgi:hypothetical protein
MYKHLTWQTAPVSSSRLSLLQLRMPVPPDNERLTLTSLYRVSTHTITPTSYSVVGSNSKRAAAVFVKNDNLEVRDAVLDALLVPPTSAAAATTTAASAATTTAAGVKARQVTQLPNQVPIYASACSGTARYSSACSCAGVTISTTYAPTPVRIHLPLLTWIIANILKASTSTTVYAAPSIIPGNPLPSFLPKSIFHQVSNISSPVCDPAQSYGYQYTGGYGEAGVGVALAEYALSEQACCAFCFIEGSACLVYEFFDNICFIVTETSGSHTPTDYCPYGQFTISNPAGGSFYGFGPCAVLAWEGWDVEKNNRSGWGGVLKGGVEFLGFGYGCLVLDIDRLESTEFNHNFRMSHDFLWTKYMLIFKLKLILFPAR